MFGSSVLFDFVLLTFFGLDLLFERFAGPKLVGFSLSLELSAPSCIEVNLGFESNSGIYI